MTVLKKSDSLDGNRLIHWYALYTRSRYEKKVNDQLKDKGIESYLPLRNVLRKWSDRKKWIEEPLFRCYVFVHVDPVTRFQALQTYGCVRYVTFNSKPAIVRDEEIENIRRILRESPDVEPCTGLSRGDIVEIVCGPLSGLRGRLEAIHNQRRLIVSIESIHQALRLNVDGLDVKVIEKTKARSVIGSSRKLMLNRLT
ncbi:UpxY family transcription antiterminator [bacterium]|nr:UpxY family transcription antiterminator [bacterium]